MGWGMLVALGLLLCLGVGGTWVAEWLNRAARDLDFRAREQIRRRLALLPRRSVDAFLTSLSLPPGDLRKARRLLKAISLVTDIPKDAMTFDSTLGEALRISKA